MKTLKTLFLFINEIMYSIHLGYLPNKDVINSYENDLFLGDYFPLPTPNPALIFVVNLKIGIRVCVKGNTGAFQLLAFFQVIPIFWLLGLLIYDPLG